MYYLISRDFYFVNYGSLSSQKKEKSVYALDLVLHRLQVHELAESHGFSVRAIPQLSQGFKEQRWRWPKCSALGIKISVTEQ